MRPMPVVTGSLAGGEGRRRRAVILTIGSELTTGRIADTNAQWAAAELAAVGLEVAMIATVDDVPGAIVDALEMSRTRGGLIWVTGGLGPTRDDLTVDAVAAWLGVGMMVDPVTEGRIRESCARRGRPVTPEALRMARIPEGAEPLANPVGTAPGLWLDLPGGPLIVLPGVPLEMKALARAHVLPRLERLGGPAIGRIYRIGGLPEGEVDRRVRDLWATIREDERLALQIDRGEVILRLKIAGHDRPAVERRIAELDRQIRLVLGDHLIGEGAEGLEQRVVSRLRERGMTMTVAESVTGGLVAARLASVEGASTVLWGGWIAYQEGAKITALGLDGLQLKIDGPVSEATVRKMADSSRRLAGVDLGLATTGWAGPSGGTAEHPVGTVLLAVSDAGGAEVTRLALRGERNAVRDAATTAALDLIRRRLG